jgi:LPXTG-site transpeptidase (sortase) family protein
MVQDIQRRRVRWNRLSLVIMGAGIASLVAAIALFVFTLTDGNSGYSGPGTTTTFGSPIDLEALGPAPAPTAPPSDAAIAQIAIPRFGVDAPVIPMGVDASGIMESPAGPVEVAWYDFTSKPGFGSNAVFSGHVDYYNYGPAVFWNLKDLAPGDVIEIRLQDGTVYKYSVATREQVLASNADVQSIVGHTDAEIITLITCGGTFDGSSGQYDQRVIVRATRIYEDPGAAATS